MSISYQSKNSSFFWGISLASGPPIDDGDQHTPFILYGLAGVTVPSGRIYSIYNL